NVTHFADDHLHETAKWFHAAIVIDGNSLTHYVNGEQERSAPLQYEAQKSGKTSLGVRLNKVHWFKGAIRTVRITPRALSPVEFLATGD
ncbi:MAG: LamG-like jellyroll fold domain-containing protein, partial [Woeseiaceae bacterium]